MSDTLIYISCYVIIFTFGLVIGSFLNVCIYRIPKHESIVLPASHCMNCGYELAWYDLVPLFSYVILGGRCRKCKTGLPLQYPLVEGMNGVLYVIIFLANGLNLFSVIYCLLTSALIVLSFIDFRTLEIPDGIHVFILILGIICTVLDRVQWREHVIGFFVVSVFLLIIYLATAGAGLGGGDIKLMAVAGLLIGWKLIILAFFIGCIVGSVIHVIRMKVSGAGKVLALGPYLSVGIFLSALWGDRLIDMYLRICGF